MLVQCWASVAEAGPTLNQHCVSVSCDHPKLGERWPTIVNAGPAFAQLWVRVWWFLAVSQQTQHIHPMLDQCLATVYDVGPTLGGCVVFAGISGEANRRSGLYHLCRCLRNLGDGGHNVCLPEITTGVCAVDKVVWPGNTPGKVSQARSSPCRPHTSKHDTLKQWCFHVGPASQTVAQHENIIVSTCRGWWDIKNR